MKKILSILIIPIIATMVFFGCKKDSVNSLDDSRNLYVEMMDSYITTDASGQPSNFIFKNNKLKYDDKKEETVESGENVMYITFGDSSSAGILKELNLGIITESAPDASSTNATLTVKNKLYQYTNIYQAMLSCIFEYYDRWQKDFYATLKQDKSVSQDDVDNLYYATKDLKKEVENFYQQKQLFEEEVASFGLDSALIKETINTFNYQYNKLIKQAFSFIEQFIDIQNRYFPMDNTKEYYATMIYGQAAIYLAKSVFYANVVSAESGEYCSIEHLSFTLLKNGKKTAWEGNTISEAMYGENGIISIVDGIVNVKKCTLTEGSENFTNRITALATMTKNIKQQFNIYMKAYNDFPIYEYKCMKFKLEAYSSTYATNIKTETQFRQGLSFENKARENIIYQFENVTLPAYSANVHSFTV